MAFFIAQVSGRSAAGRASSRKRAAVDAGAFETYAAAAAVARGRWPDGGYFIVAADDQRGAETRAIEESRALDERAR
jgi:hypothetical protein